MNKLLLSTLCKDWGFNMICKHIKVEPATWYTHCDGAGIIVWQDMPSVDRGPEWQNRHYFDGTEMKRSPESEATYRKKSTKTVCEKPTPPSAIASTNKIPSQFSTLNRYLISLIIVGVICGDDSLKVLFGRKNIAQMLAKFVFSHSKRLSHTSKRPLYHG